MPEERGDSRFASFLVGFLIGSLLAGGGSGVYFVMQERRLAREAAMQAAVAAERRAHAALAVRMAEAERAAAERERDRAEEALKQLEGSDMADDDRGDSNVWYFLLGLVTGVLLAGGGAFSFFAYRQGRAGAEVRENLLAAEEMAAVAQKATADAEAARMDAEAQRARAEAALKKAKEAK